MPQRKVIQTGPGGLRFEFEWLSSHSCGPTYGNLAIYLADQPVWPAPQAGTSVEGITALWIELLEYLSNYWLYLTLEQGYPFNVNPQRPSELDDELAKRWENMPDEAQAEEEEKAFGFRLTHNLAEASPGTLRPDLWLVRDGGMFTVEAQTVAGPAQIPATDVKRALTEVGECIAEQLENAQDARSKAALFAWTNRNQADLATQARIATGLSDNYLNDTRGNESFAVVFGDPESTWAGDNVALDVAYRFKGAITPDRLRVLLRQIKAARGSVSSTLQNLSVAAEAELANIEATLTRPYQQGRALAQWLRRQLNIVGFIAPDAVLGGWGVSASSYDFASSAVDAIAYWAHGHNPAVLWNSHDKHRNNEGALRATLSHEICHLLVDRSVSLPLAAVVGGAMERKLEQRANAFAAELLCPQREAGDAYLHHSDVTTTVNRLTQDFGVSKELAALQLAKSGKVTSPQAQREVELLGPPGARYFWS